MKKFESNSGEGFLVKNISQLLDCQQSLQNAAIFIQGETILEVGPSSELEKKYPEANHQHLSGESYFVIPGLINAHTHHSLSFLRDVAHGESNMIQDVFFKNEQRLNAGLVEAFAYPSLLASLKSGVTCSVDHYYHSTGVAKAADRMGVRAFVGECYGDLGGRIPEFYSIDEIEKMISSWSFSDRVKPFLAPHAADDVEPASWKKFSELSKSLELPLHSHLAQTNYEYDFCMKEYGKSPVKHLYDLGVLSEKSLAVHLLYLENEDLKLLKSSGAYVGYCPASQILYDRLARIDQFVSEGLPLCVGTDCPASNDQMDMLAELRLVALTAKDRGVKDLSAKEVLRAATETPARYLGESKMGQIRSGMKADLVFLKEDFTSLPCREPYVHLLFSLSASKVQHVMIDGEFVLWEQSLCKVDEADLADLFFRGMGEISKTA